MRGDKLPEVTDATFQDEVIESMFPVLVGCYMRRAGFSLMVLDTIAELKEKYKTLKAMRMDVEICKDSSAKFNVIGVPAVLLFNEGKLVGTIKDLKFNENYRKRIDALLREELFTKISEDTTLVLTDSNFQREILSGEKPAAVLFHIGSDANGPNDRAINLLNDMAKKYRGAMRFATANFERNKDHAAKYRIDTVPTLIFIKNGALAEKLQSLSLVESAVERKIRELID
ncbi:MAG: thioredoxin family protein [bacterium]